MKRARSKAEIFAAIRRSGKQFQARFQVRDPTIKLPIITSKITNFYTAQDALAWIRMQRDMRGLMTFALSPIWNATKPPMTARNRRPILRPGVTNSELWYPMRPPKAEWDSIRKVVLERDNYTCWACGHRALKYMNVHHREESTDNRPENLITTCVACHAVLHIGKNLGLKIIEIWKSNFSQAEIVQKTREGVRNGLSQNRVNKTLKLKQGPYSPDSLFYAKDLVYSMGSSPRACLPEPLCAVFVKLKRWQLE